MSEFLKNKFDNAGFLLTPTQEAQFELYAKLLVEFNEKINLTAITDYEGIIEKHFIDSLLPLKCDKIKPLAVCADVGTGAGFPGVPIAIMRDDISVTLIDSLKKRTDFLDILIDKLGLQNCKTMTVRAEDAGLMPELREKFDIVLSRAVAPLDVLSEFCLPLTAVGGCLLALKSKNALDESEAAEYAITLLGGGKPEFFGTQERNISIISKKNPTPPEYPRRAGMPEKRPLKRKIKL